MVLKYKFIKKTVSLLLIAMLLIQLVSANQSQRLAIKNQSIGYTATSGGVPFKDGDWTKDPVEVKLSSSDPDVSDFQNSDPTRYQNKVFLKKYENTSIYSNENIHYPDPNHKRVDLPMDIVNKMKTMDSGTITMEFYTPSSPFQKNSTLFSFGDTNSPSNHLHLYAEFGALGVISLRPILGQELRKNVVTVSVDQINTLAIKSSPSFGHKIFLNGVLIISSPSPQVDPYHYFHNIPNANYATIGGFSPSANIYENNLKGGVTSISINQAVMSDADLLEITKRDSTAWDYNGGDVLLPDDVGEKDYLFRELKFFDTQKNPISFKVRVDKTLPTITAINITEKTKTQYFNKSTIEITARDDASGVRDIEYQLKPLSDPIDPNGWILYDPNNKPVIDTFFKGEVVARATDNARNVSPQVSSTDIQVGVLSISAPIGLFFSAYDTGSGPVFSSSEYQIVNKSNWGVNVSIEKIQKKSNNTITLTNSTPNKEDQLKLTLSPKSGFRNKSDVLIEDSMINRKIGEISGASNNSVATFNFEGVLNSQLSSDKYYNFEYDFVFKFDPLGSPLRTN